MERRCVVGVTTTSKQEVVDEGSLEVYHRHVFQQVNLVQREDNGRECVALGFASCSDLLQALREKDEEWKSQVETSRWTEPTEERFLLERLLLEAKQHKVMPATKFTALALMFLYLRRRRATSKWTSAAKQKLQLEHLQLMVSACLHMCSKQWERKSSYQNAIPKALDRKDRVLLQHFKACELELLTVLRFQLRPATPYDFLELQLRLFAHYFGFVREKELRDLAILLLELLYFPSPNVFLQQPFELLAISCIVGAATLAHSGAGVPGAVLYWGSTVAPFSTNQLLQTTHSILAHCLQLPPVSSE
ncbi:hypothetical protein QOT17_003881 [Balamuthia mandrillaris]